MSKAMIRAQRAARRVPHGPEILEFLSSAKSRKALVAAAAEGEPPVAAISKEFAALVGPKDVKLAQVKQYAGLWTDGGLTYLPMDLRRSLILPPQFRPRLDRSGALWTTSTSTKMPMKHSFRKIGHRS
jgi:hypothetical protein